MIDEEAERKVHLVGGTKEMACDNEFGSKGYAGGRCVGILGENQGHGKCGEIGALE